MLSLILCAIACAAGYLAGRKSLVLGLGTVITVGYFYGILRANLLQEASHFIFDASALGFYISQVTQPVGIAEQFRSRHVKMWAIVLTLWPLLLLAAPLQDPLVQLVGFRGHVFLLPFLVFGARLSPREWYSLALWYGALNLMALGFAGVEFVVGLEPFYPRSIVTELIYMSRDVAEDTAFRIPATFSSAHAYGGTMVTSIPLLLGAWQQRRHAHLDTLVLLGGLTAAVLGVFVAAARVNAVVLFLLLIVALPSFLARMDVPRAIGLILIVVGTAWVVSNEVRLQRFTTLRDTEFVQQRIGGSVNDNVLEVAGRYPLGNGLGGGGTSLPYFLQHRSARDLVVVENHYAYVLLEQGVPGLVLWVLFLLWVLVPRSFRVNSEWRVALRCTRVLVAAFLAVGLIGLGLFVSIPQSAMMLLAMGWLSAREHRSHTEAQPRMARAPLASPLLPAGTAPGGLVANG
jgi:hypothetical protein